MSLEPFPPYNLTPTLNVIGELTWGSCSIVLGGELTGLGGIVLWGQLSEGKLSGRAGGQRQVVQGTGGGGDCPDTHGDNQYTQGHVFNLVS